MTPKKVINKTRKNTFRERAWKVMRALGNYSLTDLATIADVPYENIKHYHQCLVAAGYARQIGTRKFEGRVGCDKVFRLVKNTGPKTPIQKELRFLFDPNNGEYWAENPELVAEVAAGGTPNPFLPGKAITGKIKISGKPVRLLAPRKPKPEVSDVD